MNQTKINKKLFAPCGVYCGACSAYNKGSCLGCRSGSTKQKRISKSACKVRNCALHHKRLNHCGECDELVCKTYHQKLLKSHNDDPRYRYRFLALENLKLLAGNSDEELAEKINSNHCCPDCGGVITFFQYTCISCGYSQ